MEISQSCLKHKRAIMDSPLFTGGGANSVSIPPMAQTGFWRGHPPAKEGGAIGGGMNRPRLQPRCLE